MRTRTVFSIFVFTIALVFASLTFAPATAEAGGRGGDRGQHLAKELNLTPQQLEQFKTIKEKYRPRLKELRANVKTAKQDLVTSLQAPKRGDAYNTELKTKFGKVGDLKREMHQARFDMALEIRAILTDEQIAKFKMLPKHRDEDHDRSEDE